MGKILHTLSIEILYHLRCGSCGLWWSIADRKPPLKVVCPDCGTKGLLTTVSRELE